MYNKPFNWNGENFEQALLAWTTDRNLSSYKSLPVIVCWGLWIHRKKGIFEDRITTPQVVASNILSIANHFTLEPKPPWTKELQQEHIDKTVPLGYFDKVAQGEPTVCGAGAVLYLTKDHFFQLKWGLGEGTNNKVELLALYMLLIFAHEKEIQVIQIFGDSMLVTNWINNAQQCHNIHLTPILEEVSQLKSTFNLITFNHIYREQNTETDWCSKEAVGVLHPSWEI